MKLMNEAGEVQVAYLDGYNIGDKTLEDVMIRIEVKDGKLEATGFKTQEDTDYLKDNRINLVTVLADATEFVQNTYDSLSDENSKDAWGEQGIMVNDKRGEDKPQEACRVCGSQEVHSMEYNKPTMDCIEYLKELACGCK